MNKITKYLGLVDLVAEKYNKQRIDVVSDVLNKEAEIKYRENFKIYRPMTQTFYLLAIGNVMKMYEDRNENTRRTG